MHPDLLQMNAAALMDRVFTLYKDTFKMQIAFSIIMGIISITLITLLVIFMTVGITFVLMATYSVSDDDMLLLVIVLILLAFLPIYVCWTYLATSGHILISKQAFYGEQPIYLPFKESILAIFRVISTLIAQLVFSIPFIALLFLSIYPFMTWQGGMLVFMNEIHPLLLIAVGLIYGVVYVVYSNLFALTVPVAIFEKRIFFDAVIRSYKLLKGDFWKIIGIRLLWFVITYVFSYSLQGLIVVVMMVAEAFAGTVIDVTYLMYVTMPLYFLATMVVTVLVAPMDGIMTALIYFNQRIKKEGFDISVGIARLSRGLT